MVYVDGFNLYFGMRDANWRDCYWLDVQAFAAGLLNDSQSLAGTKFFTAPVRLPSAESTSARSADTAAKHHRQADYLSALTTVRHLEIFLGQYRSRDYKCPNPDCGLKSHEPEEKETDVALGTEIVADAFLDRFDTAIIVTGDTDVLPAFRLVREHFPAKWIVAAFPPERVSE